jgi:hypothetical protein
MKPLAWASYDDTSIQSVLSAMMRHISTRWCPLIGYDRTPAIYPPNAVSLCVCVCVRWCGDGEQ